MVVQTEQHLCTFCENLPTTTPWSRSGKVSHCPLCHGEILISGGVTYRIFAEPQAVAQHNRRHPWRWIGIGLGAAGVAGGALWLAVNQWGGI